MPRLSTLIAFFFVLPCISSARQEREPSWLLTAGPVYSQKWLGSEDKRKGGFFSLQYAKPEPRFTYWGNEGELALEGYFIYSTGGGHASWPITRSHQYGLMVIGRFWQRDRGRYRTFYEAGWGLMYANRIDFDLDQRINSTPMLGIGVVIPYQDKEIQIGFRWLHVSNGGTNGDNEGQNYLMGTVGLRF